MHQGTRIVIALLLGTVVTLATALTVSTARTLGSAPPGPAAATVQVYVDPAAASYTLPSLTAEQRQQITELALKDAHVSQLVQSQSPRVRDVVVWHNGPQLLGGLVTLIFPEPTTIAGEWLDMNPIDCAAAAVPTIPASKPLYGRLPVQATWSNVKQIMIFVDLPRQQVAGIAPDPEARLIGDLGYAPGIAPPKPCPGRDGA